MMGGAQKIRRLNEKSQDSAKRLTVYTLSADGKAEDCEPRQEGEGFSNALSALPEFLVHQRRNQHPSRLPPVSLLSGPSKCGKTSLLLQLAHNLAVDARARVVFICKPQTFENDYIYLSPDLDATAEVSERIHIKYVKNEEGLRKYFAAFHLHLNPPTAVLVDDFVDYFGSRFDLRQKRFQSQTTGEFSLVKCLAVCHNAMSYANAKVAPEMQCRLVISDTHRGDGPRLLYIFKRWMSQVYVIKDLGDTSKFCLELQHIKTGGMGNIAGIFTLSHGVLHFDGLEARSEAA